MKIVLILLLFISGCRSIKLIQNFALSGQKETKVSNISLFGEIIYDSSDLNKKEIPLILYFVRDSLRQIVATKRNKDNRIRFDVFMGGKKIIIASKNLYPRYLNVDSIIFFNEECFWKRTYYEDNYVWAGNTTFSHYLYNETNLLIHNDDYYRNDSLHAFMGLIEYTKSRIKRNTSDLTDYRRLESFDKAEQSKLIFFRKYIVGR